jgi:hypothetical protein
MITKNKSDYSFTVSGNDGKLIFYPEYSIEYDGKKIKFDNIKNLRVFINVITDIVCAIDEENRKEDI